MIGGLKFPFFALIVGWVNVAFRIIYTVGYLLKGPGGRLLVYIQLLYYTLFYFWLQLGKQAMTHLWLDNYYINV